MCRRTLIGCGPVSERRPRSQARVWMYKPCYTYYYRSAVAISQRRRVCACPVVCACERAEGASGPRGRRSADSRQLTTKGFTSCCPARGRQGRHCRHPRLRCRCRPVGARSLSDPAQIFISSRSVHCDSFLSNKYDAIVCAMMYLDSVDYTLYSLASDDYRANRQQAYALRKHRCARSYETCSLTASPLRPTESNVTYCIQHSTSFPR